VEESTVKKGYLQSYLINPLSVRWK